MTFFPELVRETIYWYEWRHKIGGVNNEYMKVYEWYDGHNMGYLHIHHEHFFAYNWRKFDDMRNGLVYDIYNYNIVFRKLLGTPRGTLLGCKRTDFAVNSMQEEEVWLPKNYRYSGIQKEQNKNYGDQLISL